MMADHERIQKIVETLRTCLAELDQIGASIAAAHLDSALNALDREFDSSGKVSETE